jgi:membrane-bound inhibitor of C-type lysozyme
VTDLLGSLPPMIVHAERVPSINQADARNIRSTAGANNKEGCMKSIILFLAFIGLAGSASATPTVYRCADGTVVRAAFSSPEPAGSVRLTFARQARTVTLPQVLSADGGRYADGSVEFWIKGNAARLTRAGAPTECRTRTP